MIGELPARPRVYPNVLSLQCPPEKPICLLVISRTALDQADRLYLDYAGDFPQGFRLQRVDLRIPHYNISYNRGGKTAFF